MICENEPDVRLLFGEPVVRISTDSGTTFGPILRLTSNGTIGE